MRYSNSSLVNYTRISPNRDINRKHKIDTITIHCTVGQLSVETIGSIFANPSKDASANYGIGYDGRIGLYCPEKDRSWCSSSASNDNRAITIEVASDAKHPYAVNSKAYASLIKLVTDVCKRNGIKELKWKADKSLIGHPELQNMTVHRWFAAKACPGDYLYNRMGDIAAAVNKNLKATKKKKKTFTSPFKSYRVKVTTSTADIYKSASNKSKKTGCIKDKGIYTIIAESTGTGSKKGWGKLKSGAGWISLDYCKKI